MPLAQAPAFPVEEDGDADSGAINLGQVDFSLDYIEHGHFGECPETIHEKATHFMRLLAANHSFVDGNKRTALNTTWVFYFLNGYYFDYGEEIKAILKLYAVMERMVATPEACDHFQDIAIPIEESSMLSEEIRELFEIQRSVAEKIQEAESMLEDNLKEDENVECIKLMRSITNDLQLVADTVDSHSEDNTDLVESILVEQLEWIEPVIDDLLERQRFDV